MIEHEDFKALLVLSYPKIYFVVLIHAMSFLRGKVWCNNPSTRN